MVTVAASPAVRARARSREAGEAAAVTVVVAPEHPQGRAQFTGCVRAPLLNRQQGGDFSPRFARQVGGHARRT